jgi:hypothetical protein
MEGKDLVEQAHQLYRRGDIAASRDRFGIAIAEGVRVADAWYGLAELSREGGELDAAQAAYRRALRADARHPNALYRLGELAERRGASGEAIRLYRRALAARPGHVSASRRLQQLEQATPEATPPLARQPSGNGIAGPVTAVQYRVDWDEARRPHSVLSFRVQRRGAPPVAVELRGRSITSQPANGDWVELPAGWSPGGRTQRVLNLSTGEWIASRRANPLMRAFTFAVVSFAVVWITCLFVIVGAQFFGFDLLEHIRGFSLEEALA